MNFRKKNGQALVEFALVLPLLFLLIINVVNFGAFFFAAVGVANAARAGADYLMLGPASAANSSLPTLAQVSTVVQDDLAGLPNHATATVTVCTNSNGAIQSPGTCLATVTDLQPTTSVVGEVTVTYTYTPLFAAWDFAKLGVHLTIPPTTIRRRAAVRLIQ